jgi:hypothetical protein
MPETIGYDREVKKTPNKKMKERLSHAQDRLLRGQEYRAHLREPKWRESLAQYEGSNAWRNNAEDRSADLVSVNLSFSTINTLLPFVADEDPQFIVEPYSGDATADNAKLLESFMNRVWKSNDVQGTAHTRDATFDYLLYGDGYVSVGYEINEKPIYTGDGEKVPNNVDIAEFFVERVNPWDVWIDPYSDGINNAQWVCRRVIVPRKQLEEDDRFAFTKSDAQGADVDSRYMSSEDEHRLGRAVPEDWVTTFEFYDLRENWMMTFLTGGEKIIRFIEHIVCPIIQEPNYRIPNSPYHMGELEQIASLQDELNKTRSQMITHRRRNVAKWMVKEHLLTPDAEEAIKSSKVNDIISIESNEPFANIIAPVHAIPLNADSYMIDAQIRNDINDVTGVNEYLRGVPQNISRTATEASIIEGATNIRTRHKLLQVEEAARAVGQMLLDIMKDVIPVTDFEEMTLFITGREAEKLNRATGQEELETDVELTPTSEIFEGTYEVRVERGSTELRNPEVKANQLKDMTQMMLSAIPTLQLLAIPFNMQRLMEMWFEAEGIDDVDALFEPTEEQLERQALDLERQRNEATNAGATSGGSPGSVVGGTQTQPGQPRAATTGAPSEAPDETNSGLLGPR